MLSTAHPILPHVHECEGLWHSQFSNRCSKSQPQELDVTYTFTHYEGSLACDAQVGERRRVYFVCTCSGCIGPQYMDLRCGRKVQIPRD